ncbi:MAG TPA: hypothetical protein VIR81_10285, partial [Myxococcales bacterium]
RNVSFDTQASCLVAVDDTRPAADARVNALVLATIQALEQQPAAPGKPSFLGLTLAEILRSAPPPFQGDGSLYNFPLATLDYDVDNAGRFEETELLDLVSDAQLAAANQIAPTGLAVEASGALRVSTLEKGRTGTLGFADVFRAAPLGASPSGTPGYPLCRFGVFLAEVKAAFEVTAGFAYGGGHEDFFLVPSGFRFEYDTSRPAFNAGGDPLDRNNGRVTRIWQLSAADLAAGNFDGTWEPKFDASRSTSAGGGLPPGWLDDPVKIVPTAASLFIASFATVAGVVLKDADTGRPVPGNDPNLTIVRRADGSEVKEWEALGSYVHKAGGGGALPRRYDLSDPSGPVPRRAACTGPNATPPGFCSH